MLTNETLVYDKVSVVPNLFISNFSSCVYWTADVNECTRGTDRCHPRATCHNSYGSYTCSCNTGYTGNGRSCTGKYRYLQ